LLGRCGEPLIEGPGALLGERPVQLLALLRERPVQLFALLLSCISGCLLGCLAVFSASLLVAR
jgi:hypothetical protein